jgi:hypothetical protein
MTSAVVMSFVIAAPEYVAAAATDLSNIGSAIGTANSAALGPTTNVLTAGADEVSAEIAALFGAHGGSSGSGTSRRRGCRRKWRCTRRRWR